MTSLPSRFPSAPLMRSASTPCQYPKTCTCRRPTTRLSSPTSSARDNTQHINMAPAQPELKKVCWCPQSAVVCLIALTDSFQYLDKRLFVQLNGSRKVIGVLRGYDVRTILRLTLLNTQQKLTWDLGLPQHCTRRRGRGEGQRRESETRHGGYPR